MDTTQPPVDLKQDAMGAHYGSITKPDERDHSLAAIAAIVPATQPQSYYPDLTGIGHFMQNKLGACVGHAAAKSQQVCLYHSTNSIVPLSSRFLYAYAKCTDGIPTIEGTYPRTVAGIMKNIGCATEVTCLNDTLLSHSVYTYGGVLKNIPAAAITEAAKVKIGGYAFAPLTEAGLKAAIQFAGENKGGVFMLTEIDKAWWTAPNGVTSWAAADILPLREPTDAATLGGHEVYPYAFDVKNGRTIIYIFNSWSDAWGDKGNAWFYLDEWLPHIKEIITTYQLDDNYTAPAWTYNFTKSLSFGMTNSDVVALQHALKIDGVFPAAQALTGYFGATTLASVKAFQVKYASEVLYPLGLTQPTGFVGTATIKKLNALFNSK